MLVDVLTGEIILVSIQLISLQKRENHYKKVPTDNRTSFHSINFSTEKRKFLSAHQPSARVERRFHSINFSTEKRTYKDKASGEARHKLKFPFN